MAGGLGSQRNQSRRGTGGVALLHVAFQSCAPYMARGCGAGLRRAWRMAPGRANDVLAFSTVVCCVARHRERPGRARGRGMKRAGPAGGGRRRELSTARGVVSLCVCVTRRNHHRNGIIRAYLRFPSARAQTRRRARRHATAPRPADRISIRDIPRPVPARRAARARAPAGDEKIQLIIYYV